jgi:hypothetical protein
MRGPEGASVQQCTGATRQAGGAITQIHHEVADLLYGPRAVRVRGHSQDVHVPGAGLYCEQAVQAPESHRAVHVEEIGSEHRRCLGVQELPPGRAGAPFRCRRDLQRPEDTADGGCANPVAELEQLALDPPVAPAREMLSSTFSGLCGTGNYVEPGG